MSSSGQNSACHSATKKECTYGENCYRRNPIHFQEFSHKHLEKLLSSQSGSEIKLPNTLKMAMDRAVILDQLKILSMLKMKEESKSELSDKSSGVVNDPEESIVTNKKENKERASYSLSEGKDKIDSHVNKINEKVSRPSDKEEPLSKKRKTVATSNGGFLRKWENSSPYNFFLTAIEASPRTNMENLTIKFRDLLDESLGTIESSLQINFMVELEWLLYQYHSTGNREKPLLILYGVEDDALKDKTLLRQNVKAVHIKAPHPFGHHHTKMSIFKYTDGSVRVIVHTANLIISDWENRTQGVWVGPRCPCLVNPANTTDGESPSNFRADLLRYLCSYKQSCLQEWVGHLRKIDFSAVKVCFVSSTPGSHKGPDIKHWGHTKAKHFLQSSNLRECLGDSSSWPLVIQCSSIGSLGANSSTWLCGEFRSSLSESGGNSKGASIIPNLKFPSVKMIYPSLNNVSQSHDGLLGGACLPYSAKTHAKQTWLSEYLHQWKSEARYRTRAIPHIKTYMRWHPGPNGGCIGAQMAWFILTSANLSKAAWGSLNKAGNSLYIMSYEAGVMFLPHFFLPSKQEDHKDSLFPLSEAEGQHLPPFPVPYDLPLTPYAPSDKIWQVEFFS